MSDPYSSMEDTTMPPLERVSALHRAAPKSRSGTIITPRRVDVIDEEDPWVHRSARALRASFEGSTSDS
jgi:hypothetical protein